ncbi:MAG: hypothetical protein AB7Q00_03500 [Phycisphaerales bacterium]|nr:MAG: hypothetical protein IPK69_08120 [Phycisphaerales bacterium]
MESSEHPRGADQNGPKKKPPLMRSLGAFVGHLWQAAKAEPGKKCDSDGHGVVTRRDVTEETRDTPQGPVVVRRTVIEEIEIPPGGEIYTERSGFTNDKPDVGSEDTKGA